MLENKRMKKVDIISLGCSKNLVDSEQLMRQFELAGYKLRHDPESVDADVVVVNTCGFIGDAKEESINMILELCEAKELGQVEKVYVMGCLSERYLADLEGELPEVDKFYGKFNWKELIADLGETYQEDASEERVLTTPSHYAYIKISEGCDRHCAYCAIPIITGRHKSRPIEDIEKEIKYLVAQGVKEFQIIAQELTYYGIDIYKKQMLAELIDRLAQIEGVEWLRLHYAYPAHFPLDVLDVMAKHDNVCKYMDIALQHISDNQLTLMRRHVTKQQTLDLIAEMRRRVPGIFIRTTLLVGFPGETDQDFEELKEFVETTRFERLGAFAYSHEEGTYAADHYKDDVPEDVKQARLDEIMAIQQNIAADVSDSMIDKVVRVVVDRQEGPYYVARTQYDSPEVDPEVLITVDEDSPLEIGHFYTVHIDDADVFELYASVVE